MSVILETTIGDLVVDLFVNERDRSCRNFLKLCKMKYYNFCPFHFVKRNFIAQTGDPTGRGNGGESIFAHIYGPQAAFYEGELKPRLKHATRGTLSMVNRANIASQFFLTLADDLDYLDEKHLVLGQVTEGFEVLDKLNEILTDDSNRPYQDVRISHTIVLDDPFEDPVELRYPLRSPSPSREVLESDRMCLDDEMAEEESKTAEELEEEYREKEARAQAQVLEMIGDLPSAEMRPPENVLFVCKLNPATCSEDLHIIFSRFGEILSCEVIRDWKTGNSLQYAFIEFDKQEDCENAYFKMDNVLIDDRRIHVDFSQSVAKVRWQQFLRQRKTQSEKASANGKAAATQMSRKLASALSDDEAEPPKHNGTVEKKINDRGRSNDSRHREISLQKKNGYLDVKEKAKITNTPRSRKRSASSSKLKKSSKDSHRDRSRKDSAQFQSKKNEKDEYSRRRDRDYSSSPRGSRDGKNKSGSSKYDRHGKK